MAGSNMVNQEPFTRARSTEVIASLPNPPFDSSTASPVRNANVVWDEISRSFHRMMEEINAAREPRRPESDVVQRLESVLETFVQRMNRDDNPQGARRENGTTSSSIAVQDGTLNVSQSQVLARRSVSSKLPTFTGKPEEWSVFESSFYETTELCGFSDGENIVRLQQALKGDALKAVQGRLRNAANLKEVMEELKTSFGRPEIIVQTLLSQIRRQVPPKTEKLESLIQFAISVDEMCATVRTNGVEDRYDGPLLDELVGCLPPMVKLMWGLHRITLSKVNLAAFGKWMQTIKQAAQSVTNPAAHSDRNSKYVHTHVTNSPSQNTTEAKCACENGCAQLYECDSYWQKSIADRWDIVKKNYLCKRCLRKHRAPCKETSACGKEGCTAKHHPSLHNKAGKGKQEANFSHSTVTDDNIVLRYIPVELRAGTKTVKTIAFLDEGASVSLVEQSLVDELGLDGPNRPLCLKWTGGQHRTERDSKQVSVDIIGTSAGAQVFEASNVRTVGRLGLPAQLVNMDRLRTKHRHLASIPLAQYAATPPRILIGMNNYHLTVPLKTIEGRVNEPVATKTRLGWVLSGCDSSSMSNTSSILACHRAHVCDCQDIDARIDLALKGSFALEEPRCKGKIKSLSNDDERASIMLSENTKLRGERYATGLLWRYDDVKLPNNRSMAVRRLACLERRMAKDEKLRMMMQQVLKEHIEKGYVRKLSEEERNIKHPRKWYLPIFPVFNPKKPNKVRVVWDAAAAVNGISLNSMLLTGPDLLSPLPTVLSRFREFRVALTADIQEMYHQVIINEKDQISQRFLWRTDRLQEDLDEYVMVRMTFSSACSPSCAQFVKNMNADRFADRFPSAVECIKVHHYVDDMLTSVESVPEAVKLATDVKYIHSQGGFKLHHWMATHTEVLRAVGGSNSQEKDMNIDPAASTQKVLGMWWNSLEDTFQFKVPELPILQGKVKPTKRQLLSMLMSIYDPLGLIAGFLFFLKVLLQEIWRSGVGWDDEISSELQEKWQDWLACIPHLQSVRIPRCYRKSVDIDKCKIQLHIFVDAGKDGFAAVGYFRFESEDHREVVLIGAKTRVAPLKYTSIPRLELQAAILGVRLMKAIETAHRIKIDRRYLWTDSKDVLCWLNADHRKYSIYVAHRVSEILENSTVNEWHWVSTKRNVADEGTKWSNLNRHFTSGSWFQGPEFLQQPENAWQLDSFQPRMTEEEIKSTLSFHRVSTPVINFERFSNWRRLHRAIAYLWRFINNTRSPMAARQCGHLTTDELRQAERSIFIEVQKTEFPEDYHLLKENKSGTKNNSNKNGPLFRRSAYIDDNDVLRVRGRIDACRYVGDNTKRPIILPKRSWVTDLVVAEYHWKYKHQNHQTVMNEVRQRFDIPALRSACHRVRSNCFICRIRQAYPRPPVMSELPLARLSPFTRPFSYTGIDYFGPFLVASGRRQEKRWGVLFTCLTVRAIHIEVAHSLNTSACIIALRNFIARRGTPIEIVTDRGTNFVGADRELKDAAKQIDLDELIDAVYLPDTKWRFNPPGAPHFGGAWEST
ncbi:uncharacterized protein LOC125769445 [Anopheles funestus]|uniref:uncharacterized protein LOC125769445 n=1 Tax=Anopheles funestus TaxID=62324 RepID=UPI0020C71389|nr:uncharacterized protein LOC125769445 [Anopheles funestus]